MDKLGSISLILISVIEEGVAHANLGNVLVVDLVPELFEPLPVVGVRTVHDGLIS